jgi:putative ABC transport system permease protein
MIGIIIGIAAVITIMALGEGVKRATLKDLQATQTGKQTTKIDFFNNDYDVAGDGFSADDVQNISANQQFGLSQIKIIKQYSNLNLDIEVGQQAKSEQVSLINEPTANLIAGHQISLNDAQTNSTVALVSKEFAKKSFGKYMNALDESVTVNGQSYRIIGVFKKGEEGMDMGGADKYAVNVIVPKSTYLAGNVASQGDTIKLTFKKGENASKQTKKIVTYLEKHGSQRKAGTYQYMDDGSFLEGISKAISGITIFIAAVAGISLFIAGIGVMNMMYISVAERTQEIGIRLSVGATPKNIMWQFLLEAIMLTVSGGLIGFGLGIGLAMLVAMFLPFSAVVSASASIIAFGVSSFVGIIFGLLPARLAANKNLIDILR